MEGIHKALEVMENMGEAKKPVMPDFNPPPGTIPCACGKKFIPVSEVRILNTEHIRGVTDSICNACVNNVRNMVPIVCIRCKSIVSRVQPFRDKSGFEFRLGASYHTDACPNCNKNLRTGGVSHLIEKMFFDRMRFGQKQ